MTDEAPTTTDTATPPITPTVTVTTQAPSIGRVVHYLRDGKPPLAAVITKVWSDLVVNLTVFGDGAPWDDGSPADVASRTLTSVTIGTGPGSWMWPPRT